MWVWLNFFPLCAGKIHSNVKQRWLQGELQGTALTQGMMTDVHTPLIDTAGDKKVKDAMDHFAKLTDQARYHFHASYL